MSDSREVVVGFVFADHSMSLDGFSAGPNVSPANGMGDGGERLHEWMFPPGGLTGVNARVASETFGTSGATIMGRVMLDVGLEPWGDDPPFHMPVFVVTRRARNPIPKQGGTTYHFVTGGIRAALDLARDTARGKDVTILGGANVIQQFIEAGLVDELRLHLVPVLLGDGTRLFATGKPHADLELTRTIEAPAVTHLTYRMRR